jgi:hypothetical protein
MSARTPTGPIIVWQDYGCEGWHPTSYATLAEALTKGGIDANHVVTQHIDIAAHVREPAGPKEVA